MTDLTDAGLPCADKTDGKPLAPLFTVQAVKSYKPSTSVAGYETLLPFKRKQIITVLDWDEKRDAIFGEYDSKRGWFPSSCAKILPTTAKNAPSAPQFSQTVEENSKPSSAAAKRNSIPIEKKYSTRSTTPPPSGRSLSSRDVTPSPRPRINIISSISMIPKMTSTADIAAVVTNLATNDSNGNTLKNIKFCNKQGVPLLLVNISEYCKAKSIIDMKDLFRVVGDIDSAKKLKASFESDKTQVDLSKFSEASIVSCLKSFLLGLSEPLLSFDLFESFTAAAEIEEQDRRVDQFEYLLELIPQQNYNVASYVTHFLKECTDRCEKNDFTVQYACLMFGSVFCRSHSLATIDETEKQKSCLVTKFLIENCDEMFKKEEILNKKVDKSRETRRKREKESMMNYNRQESRRARKAEKKNEKLMKKKGKTEDEITSVVEALKVPTKHQRSASSENIANSMSTVPRLTRSLSSSGPLEQGKLSVSKESPPVPEEKIADQAKSTSHHTKEPKKTSPSPTVANARQSPDVAQTMAKFYQIGFYVMLIVFIISHILRSVI